MSFKTRLDEFVSYVKAGNLPVRSATVEISEKHARRVLECKEGPLVYKGLALRCIGSRRWRQNQEAKAWMARHQQSDVESSPSKSTELR